MKIKYALLSLCLISVPAFAVDFVPDGTISDSTKVAPLDFATPVKHKGYVLSNGSCSFNCKGGRAGCSVSVSDSRCAEGYEPYIATAVVSGGGWGPCVMQHVYLQPQPGKLYAQGKGYTLSFTHAYIDTTFCGAQGLTINYSVYCR